MNQREKNQKKIVHIVVVLFLLAILGAGVTAWAYSYDQSSRWSENLLKNPDPSSTDGWSKASSGSTGVLVNPFCNTFG
ncbi:MAG: hypothetical protein IKV59_08260 [Lachnospiraceae bacterium]|nr:hypothetical protein [Lachnospiraceae bacterium]